MKIYVSGPISGKEEANLPHFRLASEHLRARGHEVVVPHDIPAIHPNQTRPCPPSYADGPEHSAACYLRGDVAALVQCDALYMLAEWETSVGARFEHSVAAHCGLHVFYEFGAIPVPGLPSGYRRG